MKPYGCSNRPRERNNVIVQDGWSVVRLGGKPSRLPRMVERPDPMSKDCRYDKAQIDPQCADCAHKSVAQ